MANNENLRPLDTISKEDAKRIRSKGGKARAKQMKERKTMKQMLDLLLEKEIKNNQGETATTLEAITVSLIKQAMSGNVKAYEVIRDTIGQNPTHKMDLQQTGFSVFVADEQHKQMLEEL
jgi:hypothetical protein